MAEGGGVKGETVGGVKEPVGGVKEVLFSG